MTVILMGHAVQLLAEETDDIVDVEILEKYLAVVSTSGYSVRPDFSIRPHPDLQDGFAITIGSSESAQRAIAEADRVLVF